MTFLSYSGTCMHACRGAEGAELTKTLPVIYFTDARSTGSVTIVFHAATESAHNLANRQLHNYLPCPCHSESTMQ